ncbi:MAG: hypothetical protein RMI91_01565 [Gemmatales bacterium]|nr:hypothetical protein [Gemmatales bacterium]MDW7993314.1 hypothetical protein [Gemmatales bacterium]
MAVTTAFSPTPTLYVRASCVRAMWSVSAEHYAVVGCSCRPELRPSLFQQTQMITRRDVIAHVMWRGSLLIPSP